MKMNLVKVPNSKESHWEYLDIFLFSNGQHTTPPRKYHLEFEELNRWDMTLRKFAHTQYDEKQSLVDLYTTKGDKVTAPIEIANNNAYVAVPPQEKFIPAAYDEYLLKATRSWEKRQGKIQKANNSNKPVNQTVNNLQEDLESKTEHSNIIAKSSTKNEQISQLNETKISSQTDNKQSLPIPRKIISNISRKTSMKTSIKNNEIPQPKKSLKVNMEDSINREQVSKTNHNIPLKCKGKEINKFGKSNTLPKNNKRKIDNKPQITNDIPYTPNITDENNITIDYPVIENLIDDDELIVVKKPDSMISDINKRVSLLSKPIVTLSNIPILPILEENKTSKEGITVDVTKPIDALSNIPILPILDKNKPNMKETMDVTRNILLHVTEDNYKTSDIICNMQYDTTDNKDTKNNIDQYNATSINLEHFKPIQNTMNDSNCSKENFISIIDRGELIDFSLKIELKKCNGTIKTQYNTDNKQHFISEKESRLETETVYKQPIENKSDTVKDDEEKLSKMIVVQCPCCIHEDFDEILQKIDMSTDQNDKMYVVLIPYLDYKKQTIRCNCDQDANNQSENGAGIVGLNIITPAMTIHADTSSIKVIQKDGTQIGRYEIQNNDVSPSRKKPVLRNNEENPKSNTENDKEVTRKEENINLQSSQLNYVEFNKAGPSEETESIIVRTNASNMTNHLIDKSTQTEWSSVLLEAKRHEDGHYSFHLPPLSVLKYYFW